MKGVKSLLDYFRNFFQKLIHLKLAFESSVTLASAPPLRKPSKFSPANLPVGNLLSVNLPDVNLIVSSINDVSMYNRQGNIPG